MDNSLFAGNAFTVVNFWFNGCKPCVEELDDLNALNEKVKAQGGEVIGINTETLDGNQQGIDAAKKLLADNGRKLPQHLLCLRQRGRQVCTEHHGFPHHLRL
ncbi:MAG: TlpA disulfide reductase family protein [Faecalibacterium prausnitzii]